MTYRGLANKFMVSPYRNSRSELVVGIREINLFCYLIIYRETCRLQGKMVLPAFLFSSKGFVEQSQLSVKLLRKLLLNSIFRNFGIFSCHLIKHFETCKHFPGGGVLPYKGLMGTCGQPGYVFRDFCLKQGIEFNFFCLNQGIDFSIFVLNRISFLGR